MTPSARLTGVSPFIAKTVEQTLERNAQYEVEFPEELWANISPEAKDLVVNMTVSDPYDRFSVQTCLTHKWITSHAHRTVHLKSALEKLKNASLDYNIYINVLMD